MIHRALVLLSVACCVLVSASFLLFARDQLAGASKHQTTEIVAGNQTNPVAIPVHKARQQPRRFIDGAAADLTSPFKSIASANSAWVQKGVPTLIALLVYGVGIGFVARYARGLS